MPWKDLRPMDERVLFVADYVRELYSFSELCTRYGVSRKTGYKWVDRYRREGVEGLGERSRRPQRQPTQLPYAMQRAIIELRGSRRTELGPKKIQVRLGTLSGPTGALAHDDLQRAEARRVDSPAAHPSARGARRRCRGWHQGSQWTVER